MHFPGSIPLLCSIIFLYPTQNTAIIEIQTFMNNTIMSLFDCGDGQQIDIYQRCNGISECRNGRDEMVLECGCLAHEFHCNNTCIDQTFRCDRKFDCEDKTDEVGCELYPCPPTHIKCTNEFCVPRDAICNYTNDCGDNSDEKDCPRTSCWYGTFTCANSKCISPAFLCDNTDDCLDRSDENHCEDSDFRECADGSRVHRAFWCDDWPECADNVADELYCRDCTTLEYRCPNSRCIRKANVCDSVCDCGLLCEDEMDCQEFYIGERGSAYCLEGSTMVCNGSNRCISQDFICDGFNDCRWGYLGTDEMGCWNVSNNCTDYKDSNDTFACSDGRCLHISAKCNYIRDCVDGADEKNCIYPMCDDVHFRCLSGQCITLNMRCNTEHDCRDKSDELQCDFHECGEEFKRCRNGQCVAEAKWCNYQKDCFDNSDETNCTYEYRNCTDDEYQCVSGQCIPLLYKCFYNRNFPTCSDESNLRECGAHECSDGQFKCHNSYCINSSHVCDGEMDCKKSWTDEDGCPFLCSRDPRCFCIDELIDCTNLGLNSLPEEIEPKISKLYFSGNFLNFSINEETFRPYNTVSHLDLSNNSIVSLNDKTFLPLWHLTLCSLKDNNIQQIRNGTFLGLSNLKLLDLEGNGISVLDPFAFNGLSSLPALDLSRQQIKYIPRNTFVGLRKLTFLNLSYNLIENLVDGSLNGLQQLRVLSLSHNNIKIIEPNAFHGLTTLQRLITDEFRFCCLAKFVPDCLPKADEFSSCEDLMSNLVLRVCIWVLGVIALVGNGLVVVWRCMDRRESKVHSFLITNLAFGDMLMGIYLLIIAAVDYHYRGVYIIYDQLWRESILCHFAGFMSTFSSELSVFTLTVITMDRVICITYPFRIKRLDMTSARIVMAVVWLAVALLASLPLSNRDYFKNYYGRSGVCLPLHITQDKPNGWEYSIFIFLALNFASILIISMSYLWMFVVAKKTQKAARTPEMKNDNAMARRMTSIVFTDFCCWMPIILLGIISLSGITIPPQVFAWIAVFVLPFNAAVNPVLYTLSTAPFLRHARKRASHFRRSFISSLTRESRLSSYMDRSLTSGEKNQDHRDKLHTSSTKSSQSIEETPFCVKHVNGHRVAPGKHPTSIRRMTSRDMCVTSVQPEQKQLMRWTTDIGYT